MTLIVMPMPRGRVELSRYISSPADDTTVLVMPMTRGWVELEYLLAYRKLREKLQT